MENDGLVATFNQQAAGYDKQWAKLAPIRELLHFLLGSVFGELPVDARVLCVGLGTGAELAHMATRWPHWTFTAVEPSGAMLEICRRRAESDGFAARCSFHEGYVDSLPRDATHDAATCFLVSQFILDRQGRADFFHSIAQRLAPGATLASSDLTADLDPEKHEALVRTWMRMMAGADIPPDGIERMREAWRNSVAILPGADIESLISAGGFTAPTQFFQAGLIHAWFARRSAPDEALKPSPFLVPPARALR